MRYKITISYDGSKFKGFQQQSCEKRTVLGKIYEICKKLNIKSQIVGSGRTDKEVHANNQILHLDTPSFWADKEKLKNTLNHHLYPFIYVKKIELVDDDFHARFDAKKREYRYIISHENYSPYLASYVYFYSNIDIDRLNVFLKLFEGEHNFEMFKKSGSDVKNFVRTIFEAKSYSYKNRTIIKLQANGFLRSQVRMIVKTSLLALEEKLTKDNIIDQLECKKIYSKKLAPPQGLYLNRIFY